MLAKSLPRDWSPLLTRRATRRSSSVAYWLGVVVLLLVVNLYAPGEPTFLERLLASTIVMITAIVSWVWIQRPRLEVAFMPMFSVSFSIYFALPIFILVS